MIDIAAFVLSFMVFMVGRDIQYRIDAQCYLVNHGEFNAVISNTTLDGTGKSRQDTPRYI